MRRDASHVSQMTQRQASGRGIPRCTGKYHFLCGRWWCHEYRHEENPWILLREGDRHHRIRRTDRYVGHHLCGYSTGAPYAGGPQKKSLWSACVSIHHLLLPHPCAYCRDGLCHTSDHADHRWDDDRYTIFDEIPYFRERFHEKQYLLYHPFPHRNMTHLLRVREYSDGKEMDRQDEAHIPDCRKCLQELYGRSSDGYIFPPHVIRGQHPQIPQINGF